MRRWTLLHGDPRFVLAPWRARAVYQQLLDAQDAAGDFVAPARCTLLDALGVELRCAPDEARAIVAELVAAGLVEARPDRLCLLVCSARGRAGGKSPAERKRDQRARARAQGGPSDRDPSPAPGRDASHVTGRDMSHVTVTPEVTGDVTRQDGGNATQSGEGHGAVTFGAVTRPGLPGSPPAVPSPVPSLPPSGSLPLSPISPPSRPPATGPTARAREGRPAQAELLPGQGAPARPPPKPSRKPKPARPDVVPAAGTLARQVHDAIVGAPVLGATTRRPGEFATRITQPGAFPGVDVLAQVHRCEAWAATARREVKDGNATLANWLARAAEDAARPGAPAPSATSVPAAPSPPARPAAAQDVRRGRIDAAPRERFDAIARAAGVTGNVAIALDLDGNPITPRSLAHG